MDSHDADEKIAAMGQPPLSKMERLFVQAFSLEELLAQREIFNSANAGNPPFGMFGYFCDAMAHPKEMGPEAWRAMELRAKMQAMRNAGTKSSSMLDWVARVSESMVHIKSRTKLGSRAAQCAAFFEQAGVPQAMIFLAEKCLQGLYKFNASNPQSCLGGGSMPLHMALGKHISETDMAELPMASTKLLSRCCYNSDPEGLAFWIRKGGAATRWAALPSEKRPLHLFAIASQKPIELLRVLLDNGLLPDEATMKIVEERNPSAYAFMLSRMENMELAASTGEPAKKARSTGPRV